MYRLSVQKRSVIPPQSVKYVTLIPDRPIQNSICVDTNKDLQGLMPLNSAIDKDQTTIPFRNPTDRYITLKQGQCIGTVMEINDIFDLEGDETFSINKVTIESKIEKVPRGIQGEKSSKDMASSRNLVSTIGAQASPKKKDGTRCPEG